MVPQAHCLLRRALPISALPIVSMAVELGTEHAAQMKHHVVQGKILLPGAAMLETCLAGASALRFSRAKDVCSHLSTHLDAPHSLLLQQLLHDSHIHPHAPFLSVLHGLSKFLLDLQVAFFCWTMNAH